MDQETVNLEDVTIRFANQDDFQSAFRLYGVLLEEDPSFTREAYGAFLSRPDEYLALALDKKGEALGCIAWTIWHPSLSFTRYVCFLQDMVVVPEARFQGVGTKLIDHVRDWASDHDVRILHLETDKPENLEFFGRKGFRSFSQGLFQFLED